MTRPLPLVLLTLFVVWFVINVPPIVFWIGLGGSVILLLGLIWTMWSKGMFVGPETLIDDFKESSKEFFRDTDGEAERLELLRRQREARKDENDDEVIPVRVEKDPADGLRPREKE
jgi:hypothetical protein